MKLELLFELKKTEIVKDYRRTFLHIFKTALTQANNGKYYDQYYTEGKSKNFTFSVYFPDAVFKENTIEIPRKMGKLYFSTADSFAGFVFYSAFLELQKTEFQLAEGNTLKISSVKKLNEQLAKGRRALVKTMSPLCIRNHTKESNYDYYYSTEHEKFPEECQRVIGYQLMQAGFSQKICEEFTVTPVNTKKVIVTFYDNKIECSLGYFLLEGDTAAINYLLKAGAGSRHSCGFGTLQYQME